MKIFTGQREIKGTLKTLLGTYSLLEFEPHKSYVPSLSDSLVFRVVDDSGFDNYIWVRGDFIVIPSVKDTLRDVKRISEEEETLDISIEQSSVVE